MQEEGREEEVEEEVDGKKAGIKKAS